jgi:hypothetical protein
MFRTPRSVLAFATLLASVIPFAHVAASRATSPSHPSLQAQRAAATRFVSPSGADSNSGTSSAPWRTISKALSSAQPGDTVLFRGGTYGARGARFSASKSGAPSSPITFRSYPGETPVLLGAYHLYGSYRIFSGFLFAGPTGSVKSKSPSNPKGEDGLVAIKGDHVTLAHSEIRGADWHFGVFVSGAHQVRVVGDYIHDNGDDQEPYRSMQANNSHGIYFSSGSGVVANNVIEHNLARGVQLYPSPTDVLVTQNTIVRNGKAGVIVSNDAANNTVANNSSPSTPTRAFAAARSQGPATA